MGILLCLYYNTEYMTDIVAFPKIFRRNILEQERGAVRENGGVFDGFLRRRGMGVAFGTTVRRWDETCTKNRCLSRIRRVVILWDKMTTLEGAHHVLTNNAAGRHFAAPLRCFSVLYSLSTSGKPALFGSILIP